MSQDYALRSLFTPGASLPTRRGSVRMEHRTIAQLAVRAERLIVCDPLVPIYRAPLALRLGSGDYPVVVALACFPSEERVAFAYVRLLDTMPERWESAPTLGFDPTAAGILDAPGYGVDSGTGCFLDQIAANAFFAKMDGDECEAFGNLIMEQMRSHQRPGWSWADVVLDANTGSNLVAFSSGMGDGFYSSFCGYDAAGELVCIVTDFQCEEWGPIATSVARSKPVARPWWKVWG